MASFSTGRDLLLSRRRKVGNGGLLLASILVLAATVAQGVEPIVWRQDSLAEFELGEVQGLSLTWDGRITLAPRLEAVGDTGEEFVWALARDASGALVAATGNHGKLFRLDDKGARELLFDSPEVALFSLAVGPDGVLYAGSSPDGLIYKVRPGKTAETFCTTGDSHVWALAVGGDGVLYAATGGKQHGRVLRIDPSGSAEEMFRTPDQNIVSLLRTADGTLYAGSDGSGLIYRLKPGADLEVLYDAPMEEIHVLAPGPNGLLYAGAMSQKRNGSAGSGNGAARNGSRQQSSAVYVIRPSGSAFELWRSPDPLLVGLRVGREGEITAATGGTGDRGALYRIFPDGRSTLLTTMEDAPPWAFLDTGSAVFLGTSGEGKVYRFGTGTADEGTLTSTVKDFGLVSSWGQFSWKATTPPGTSAAFQTRSGNSELPDNTWSDWTAALTTPGPIKSRPARFLQYRLRLKGSGKGPAKGSASAPPEVREVVLTGQQENVRPMLISLSVGGPSSGGEAAGAPPNGVPRPEPVEAATHLSVTWSAADVNNDKLLYALYYRGEGERQWKLLDDQLMSTTYQWNTDSAPEGTTQIRLVVSDAPSNPKDSALTSEQISEPFEIDHSPPVVTLAKASSSAKGQVTVTGRVVDATSALRSAEYSLNAGLWQVVFPVDGIFDTPKESLALDLSGLPVGEYTLVIRATDARGNIGVARQVVDVR